jgi:ABC-2 type transport system permease protein
MNRQLLLLKIEWFKLNRVNTLIWFGLFALLVSLLAYLTGMNTVLITDPVEKQKALFESFLAVAFGLSDLFMIVMVIILSTREYAHNVGRKKLINGYSREELFESHILFLMLFSFIAIALLLISWLVFSALIQQWPINKGMLTLASRLPLLWPYLFSHGLYALLIAVLVRKTGIAILLYIALRIGESILYLANDFFRQKYEWPIVADDVLPATFAKRMLSETTLFTEWQGVLSFVLINLFLFAVIYLRVKKSDF